MTSGRCTQLSNDKREKRAGWRGQEALRMALMKGMRLVPGLAQKPSDPDTHALLINSERLDVSPP